MSRSERYIAPSAAKLLEMKRQAELAEALAAQRTHLLDVALRRLRKGELIDILMSLDTYNPAVRWDIEAAIQLKKPVDLVVHDLKQAIGMATKVNERELNHNFEYNWQAYAEVQRGLKNLILMGQLEVAKQISIEFMEKASYQVECSDEGAMSEDIEACLQPVIEAVKTSATADATHWAFRMMTADRVGFLCREELKKLSALA